MFIVNTKDAAKLVTKLGLKPKDVIDLPGLGACQYGMLRKIIFCLKSTGIKTFNLSQERHHRIQTIRFDYPNGHMRVYSYFDRCPDFTLLYQSIAKEA